MGARSISAAFVHVRPASVDFSSWPGVLQSPTVARQASRAEIAIMCRFVWTMSSRSLLVDGVGVVVGFGLFETVGVGTLLDAGDVEAGKLTGT
jgi:hypothetical protein